MHLSADFGVVCEFAQLPLTLSPPPCRPGWTLFRPAWEYMEELQDEVDSGPQGKDMVPTDVISHISWHGYLQLLREMHSLFAFVSPC